MSTPRPVRRLPAGSRSAAVYVFDRESIRRVDAEAAEAYGLPTIVLMENAASQVASAVLDELPKAATGSVLICCGPGQNGGDGLAAARHLHNSGVPIGVLLSHEPRDFKGDARTQLAVCVRMGIEIICAEAVDPYHAFDAMNAHLGRAGVIVDALLGTGLDRPVVAESSLSALVCAINDASRPAASRPRARVVAVDIPSGLDADTGKPMVDWSGGGSGGIEGADGGRRTAVRADLTVSMVGLKVGFMTLDAQPFVGDVMIADIGIPAELAERLGRVVELNAHGGGGPAPRRRPDRTSAKPSRS